MSKKPLISPEPLSLIENEILDTETYSQKISKLQIEAEVILSQKPFNNLRVNKSKRQLYEILKLHNEKYNVSTDELPRTQYRLGQLGVKWNQIEQYLALEKFKIDKKHSEMIYERPSLFSVQKKGEQALQDYLEKNFNLQLFNKVDSVTNKMKSQVNSFHKDLIFETYMEKTTENRKQMQLQKKNFTFYKKPEIFQEAFFLNGQLGYQEKFTVKQGIQGMDPKQRAYFNSFEKYIQNKYINQNRNPETRHDFPLTRLIREFYENTQSIDIQTLWSILLSHVDFCDQFYKEHQDSYEYFEDIKQDTKKLKSNSKNLLPLFVSSQQILRKELVKKSLEQLQEDFYNTLSQNENCSLNLNAFSLLDNATIKSVHPILCYVEKEFILSDFRSKHSNFILFDEFQCPIWAIFYVLLRAGMDKIILKLVDCYKGNVKVDEFGLVFSKYLQLQNINEDFSNEEKKRILDGFVKGHEKIDIFQLILYNLLVKNCEIPSTELILDISNYIWINLKLCVFDENERARFEPTGKKLFLREFQEHYISFIERPTRGNVLVYLKPLFLILCYEEALTEFKSVESYFNDFVHMLIVIRESGLIFDFSNDKCKQLDLKEILYKYVRNFVKTKPLEAFYYLRLLPFKDMVSLIANCIVNNELLPIFFESNAEAKKNCNKLRDLLGIDNFKMLVHEIIKNLKTSNLEMSLKLFDLIQDYEKVLSLIIEFETEKIISIPKKTQRILSADKLANLQITINSILSVYKASEILDKNCKDSNQIIMVLQYLVQIKSLLENRNNENRFEEVFKKIKVWKLIPINEEQNEKYRDFYILFQNRKCSRIYLELLILCFEVLKELGSQKRRNLAVQEDAKKVFGNLFGFIHNYLKNIELEENEERETLKKVLDLAHNTSIIF